MSHKLKGRRSKGHIKGCSVSAATREEQVKPWWATSQPIRMWLAEETGIAASAAEGMEKPEPSCGEREAQSLWRATWKLLRGLDIEIPDCPAVLLLPVHQKRWSCCVHAETWMWMPIASVRSRWPSVSQLTGKQKVRYPRAANGLVVKWIDVLVHATAWLNLRNTCWEEPDMKVRVLYGLHSYIMSRMGKSVQTWSTLVGGRDCRRQE